MSEADSGSALTRARLAACLLGVIAAGLASRKYPFLLPAALGKYPGDALWAVAVFVLLSLIWPCAPLGRRALGALLVSYAVELSQLYHRPWIDSIRHTTIGHLFLGTAFGWGDVLAYTVGIALAWAFHAAASARRP
ncbi:MAG: DUF2809 domain-containing protein [Gammaproteobacteria bacterium]